MSVQLGKFLDSPVLHVWSTILIVLLVIIWLANHVLTIRGILTGQLVGLNDAGFMKREE